MPGVMSAVCRSALNLSLDVWEITAPLEGDSAIFAGTWAPFVCLDVDMTDLYLSLKNVTTLTLGSGT
jgi:hypothetical protein